jgi:hypothetical protein
MYKTVDIPKPILDQVNRALNFILNALGPDTKTVRYRADLVSLYLVVSHLMKTYALTGREGDLRNFVKDFFSNLRVATQGPYWEYLQTRFDIMLGKFLQFVPNILPKDTTRLFNEGEKLALYYRDGGKCQHCGKDTPFDKGHAHHKQAHSLGGPTTIDNGQWLCAHCNHSLRATP